jgi:hypothetical protein
MFSQTLNNIISLTLFQSDNIFYFSFILNSLYQIKFHTKDSNVNTNIFLYVIDTKYIKDISDNLKDNIKLYQEK